MELNESTLYKLNTLIEANQAVKDAVAKYRPISDTLTMAPVISGIGQMAQGYQVGKELNHKVAGTLLGAEAAAGAASKHDNTVSIGDVYTRRNMAKRGVQGAAIGAGIAGMNIAAQKHLQGGMPEVKDLLQHDKDQGGFNGYIAGEALQAADNPVEYAGEEAGAMAAGTALLAPGIKYGLGKIFGRKDALTKSQRQSLRD